VNAPLSSGLSVVPSSDEHEDPAVLILREARCLYAQKPAWTEFYRHVLGSGGLIAELFSPDERAAFERSPAHEEIQAMLAMLRRVRPTANALDFEPTRVITVRLPKSLHEALRAEAHRLHASMNSLAITKLLAAVDPALVPNEF
jgi:hypothetical protein